MLFLNIFSMIKTFFNIPSYLFKSKTLCLVTLETTVKTLRIQYLLEVYFKKVTPFFPSFKTILPEWLGLFFSYIIGCITTNARKLSVYLKSCQMYFCDFWSGNLKMFLRYFGGCLSSQILEFKIFKIFIYSATLKHNLILKRVLNYDMNCLSIPH